MTVVFYMNCLSAHQIPLAREVAKLIGAEKLTYVDAEAKNAQPLQTVKDVSGLPFRVVKLATQEAREILHSADLVLTGLRDLDLIERRAAQGLRTFYYSERWFKPVEIGVGGRCRCRVVVSGFLRMLVPSYRRMVRRFVRWTQTDPLARVLAVGPWAAKDFVRMGVPAEKIVRWGYFVEPSTSTTPRRIRRAGEPLKLLWAGREIPLKHVPDIRAAVRQCRAQGLAVELTTLSGVTMQEVREAMRAHDTFVFASNGFEGWGAVVSEALEEGMNVIGSRDCGAPPTLLSRERLFHSGDVKALARLIGQEFAGALPVCTIGDWTAAQGARRLMDLSADGKRG